MKTIFNGATRNELISRINTVDENSPRQWGKMSVYQMVRHCSLFDEWMLGKNDPVYKQAFIGRIFGRMALRRMLKDDSPLGRNLPTTPDLKISESSGDLALEKTKWIGLIEEYEYYSNPDFVHDFFGEMTVDQIGCFVFKHTDHHLRQFSV